MLASWMAYATVLGALVYGAAVAAERVASTWSLSRRFIWVASLVVAVVSPAILVAWPQAQSLGPAVLVSVQAPVTQNQGSLARLVTQSADLLPTAIVRRIHDPLARLEPFAGPLWVLASLVCLGFVARATIAVRRRRGSWAAIDVDGTEVLVAPNVGPAVVGAIKPRIVIPHWVLTLDGPERALILTHEREHLRARDPIVLMVALLGIVAFPWNAALWLITRRLRLAVEIDCDRRVLLACDRYREYGELLLTVSARYSAPMSLVTSLAQRRLFLERRIKAMTTTTHRHPRFVSAVCIIAVVAATTAAVVVPRPAAIGENGTLGGGPDSLSVAELQTILAARHPNALLANSTVRGITVVVDANGNYVVSVADQRPADGGGRSGRSGNPTANLGAPGLPGGRGRSGNGTAVAMSDQRAWVVKKTQLSTLNPITGAVTVAIEETSAGIVRGDTMQLHARALTDSTVVSDRVFTLVGVNMERGDVLPLQPMLAALSLEPERVESIHARGFDAGELGASPLHIFVVRLKP